MIKKLSPEHAERVAENWTVDDWFVASCPFHLKLSYVKALIARGLAMGVFEVANPVKSVGWTFRKMGRCTPYSYSGVNSTRVLAKLGT